MQTPVVSTPVSTQALVFHCHFLSQLYGKVTSTVEILGYLL